MRRGYGVHYSPAQPRRGSATKAAGRCSWSGAAVYGDAGVPGATDQGLVLPAASGVVGSTDGTGASRSDGSEGGEQWGFVFREDGSRVEQQPVGGDASDDRRMAPPEGGGGVIDGGAWL